MAGGRGYRGLFDGRNVSGVRMWLEVGETEDGMVHALYQEPGCGWRKERQGTVWWMQCIRSKFVAGERQRMQCVKSPDVA